MRRRLPLILLALAVVAASAQAVAVTLKDFKISMPAKLPAGPTTFTVKNTGKNPHDLVVVYHAQGTKFRIPKVQPGNTRTKTVNLKPGAYVLVCDVFNGYHASQGMVARFTVGTFNFNTAKWSA